MDFFSRQIESKGLSGTVEQWIFSTNVNTTEGVYGSAKMFSGLFSGLLHPLIHVGYGLEFDLPGMVIEGDFSIQKTLLAFMLCLISLGLAMAAVQTRHDELECIDLIAEESFKLERWTTTLMSNLSVQNSASTEVHALTLMARILKDDALRDSKTSRDISEIMGSEAHKRCSPVVLRHIEDWRFDASNAAEVDRKLKEVIWTTTLIYVAGWKQGKRFRGVFFLCVTLTIP